MSRIGVLHVATSKSGGAGIAARRINQAFLGDATIDSKLLYRGASTKDIDIHEIGVQDTKITEQVSSIVTFTQQKIIQNSSRLVSPIELDNFPYEHPAYLSADIVHFHAFYNFVSYETLRRVSSEKRRVFVTLHDERLISGGCHYTSGCRGFINSCEHCPQVRPVFKKLVAKTFANQKYSISNIDNIELVCPSDWLARQVRLSSIWRAAKIHVVRNPIPNTFKLKCTSDIREKLGISESSKVIGFIASDITNPYKGFEVLKAAINRMSGEYKDTYVLLAIGGSKNLEGLSIAVFNIEAKGDYQVRDALGAMDVLVVPSTEDNSPNVIGEALVAGLAVIGSDAGGVAEMLRDCNLPVFQSMNSKDLAGILEHFDFQYDRKKLQQYAETHLDFSSVANKMKDIYLNGF